MAENVMRGTWVTDRTLYNSGYYWNTELSAALNVNLFYFTAGIIELWRGCSISQEFEYRMYDFNEIVC